MLPALTDKPFLKNAFRLVKGLLIVGVLGWLLWFAFQNHDNWLAAWQQAMQAQHVALLIVAIALLPFNWLLEALKWKVAVQPLCFITWQQSLKGVLSGLAAGLVTPQSLGDLTGRAFWLPQHARIRLTDALLAANYHQMIVTATLGAIASVPLLQAKGYFHEGFYALIVLFFFGSYIILFGINILLKRLPDRFRPWVTNLTGYSRYQQLKMAGLAWLRYGVFTAQFILLLRAVNISWPLTDLLPGVAFVFLAKSLLPSLNVVGDLGLRELSVWFYFETFGLETAPIVAASLLLWLINLLLPSLAGVWWLIQARLFENTDHIKNA